MRNLLVIFNVAYEDPVCELFLPYWRRSGCDIMFSSPMDAKSSMSGPGIYSANYGRSIGLTKDTWWHYQSRVLDTFKGCLQVMTDYDGFIFTQYDSIALDRLPEIGLDDSIHRIAGYTAPGFQSSFLLHPPWCFGRNRLQEFVQAADKYDIRTTEHGVMDRWLSLIIEREKLPFTPCTWGWTANSINTPKYVSYVRQAIANGCLFVHGVKNKKQLDAIMGP